jgi:hypothetical protein
MKHKHKVTLNFRNFVSRGMGVGGEGK